MVWLSVVAPANAEFAGWLTNPIPTDFAGWRRQWEYGHAARAVIHIVGLSLLVVVNNYRNTQNIDREGKNYEQVIFYSRKFDFSDFYFFLRNREEIYEQQYLFTGRTKSI